jgi:hypothetical protein
MSRLNHTLAGALAFMAVATNALATGLDDTPAQLDGTIVSVRSNILAIRPNLRHILTRAEFNAQTEITSFEVTTIGALKPGLRVMVGGEYTPASGMQGRFIEVAEAPMGDLKRKFSGIQKEDDHSVIGGRLKSVVPFIVTDDAGTDFAVNVERLFGIFRSFAADRNSLMIGVRVHISGKRANDGVLMADSIQPDRDFAKVGAMFGTLLAVKGDRVTIRPRFTTDAIEAQFTPKATIQRQIAVDPDTIHVGDGVTFWGVQRNNPWDFPKSDDMRAIALLLGSGKYPPDSDPHAPHYYTGRIESLEPKVKLRTNEGKSILVWIPAQMVTARLVAQPRIALKRGDAGMFVLNRHADGRFDLSAVIVDAPPWVGYGE